MYSKTDFLHNIFNKTAQNMLFDSHCHFTDPGFDDCRDQLAEQIRDLGLTIADIGTDLDTSLAALRAAKQWDFCYAVAGWHPSEVGRLNEELLARTLELCKEPKVVAVGEIGLDYHWEENPPREIQQHWFRRQLQEAVRLGMPVCIHSRDADGDTLQILKEEVFLKRVPDGPGSPERTVRASDRTKVLMHCFSGSAELARQYVKLGAKISLGGPVTYKNARHSVNVAEAMDIGDLLIETDSPYMAPVPMRGKQNKPTYVQYVAKKIAEIKGMTYKEAADATYRNACCFYGIAPAAFTE